jgi:hypothetical protein
MHGMAYDIFLKSLRSLEEFRKNPQVKIPPKSPSTNFPSLGKFKIQFLFEKNSSSEFSPLGLAGLPAPPALAYRPAQAIHPPRPKPPSPLGLTAARPAHAFSVFYRRCFPLRFTPSRAGLLHLISLTTGPRLSASSPTSSRPSSPAPPPIPSHRAPLRTVPRVPSDHYHLAFISPPLIPLLNLSSSRPSSMSLKTLTPALTAPATSPRCSPDPIKGEQSLRASPHLSPLSFPSLRALASLSPSADTTEPSPSSPALLDAAQAPVRP